MSLANTSLSYGAIARFFHWSTALLILVAIPLGVIAHGLPYETDAELARKATLFSIHKTVGIAAFFVALARILWALTQRKPAAVHPERRLETWAAETAHWLLYASMVIVPLSGWLHHAATTGFAPILWPFGQTLPFVPVEPAVADFFGAWHWVFTKVLAISVGLHIAGALKHAVIDRDGVLARMASGRNAGTETQHGSRAPQIAAALVVGLAVAGGTALGLPKPAAESETLAEVESGWVVDTGTLEISILQLGGEVNGSFADWTAAIDFDPEASGDTKGSVEVTISIISLTLGTVTEQAMSADHFNTEAYPTATFTADILDAETGYVADGTLTLKGTSVLVALPFELDIEGDAAQASGTLVLDRRDFNIGESLKDESSLGFPVTVTVQLAATRSQ